MSEKKGRGGVRPNAGRPGRFGEEPTERATILIPVSGMRELRRIGDGSASLGVMRLLERASAADTG